jgi:hypothetical protein
VRGTLPVGAGGRGQGGALVSGRWGAWGMGAQGVPPPDADSRGFLEPEGRGFGLERHQALVPGDGAFGGCFAGQGVVAEGGGGAAWVAKPFPPGPPPSGRGSSFPAERGGAGAWESRPATGKGVG